MYYRADTKVVDDEKQDLALGRCFRYPPHMGIGRPRTHQDDFCGEISFTMDENGEVKKA
jgi:hypothetical protein